MGSDKVGTQALGTVVWITAERAPASSHVLPNLPCVAVFWKYAAALIYTHRISFPSNATRAACKRGVKLPRPYSSIGIAHPQSYQRVALKLATSLVFASSSGARKPRSPIAPN